MTPTDFGDDAPFYRTMIDTLGGTGSSPSSSGNGLGSAVGSGAAGWDGQSVLSRTESRNSYAPSLPTSMSSGGQSQNPSANPDQGEALDGLVWRLIWSRGEISSNGTAVAGESSIDTLVVVCRSYGYNRASGCVSLIYDELRPAL